MSETPKQIRALLIGVAIVVALAIGAVVGVTIVQATRNGGTPEPDRPGDESPSVTENPGMLIPHNGSPKLPTTTVKAHNNTPHSPVKAPDLPIKRPDPKISISGRRRKTLMVDGGSNRLRIDVAPGMVHGKPVGVDALPVAKAVKTMDLGAKQRAAVEEYDKTFKASISERVEHDQRAIKEVYLGLADAIESGDKQRIDMALEQVANLAEYQAKAIEQLSRQYAEDIGEHLTAAQRAQLDKLLRQMADDATRYTSSLQSDGSTVDVMIPPPGSCNK